MARMADGVAHISFRGGGTFVPVRNPYDRQTMIEHVLERVRSRGRVQVLLGHCRWLVDWSEDTAVPCSSCGCTLAASCTARVAQRWTPLCVWCAFGAPTPSGARQMSGCDSGL